MEISPEKLQVLEDLVGNVGDGLSENQREEFLCLLKMYADVFSDSDADLGRTNKLKHEIHT